ncbi:hypothetical protein [Mycolicibacter algericus]|uniref:Uncharacterized protein n=2 Tax=Mycolicibacter algericus TaxID=1288388 RepID=A0A7I9Y4Q9_MYCAL|nr:hypothetical protein [Mycolicibacter algericus]OQZ91478.1 hypothetical protein BST10_21960 [Mycolicibacter algericus DSM 45454]GFG83463.1 hypothetical protein MALGJ_01390 [Mycolicibacter algericus]
MSTSKELEIEDERTAEKRYGTLLREKASRPLAYQGPRNGLWTGTGLPARREVPVGELVGRVALASNDQYLWMSLGEAA